MKNKFIQGFSAIEILVVITIIVLLSALIIPKFSQMRNAQILQNTTLDVYNALNKARSNTLASLDSNIYGVHFSSSQVIIFVGTTYTAGAGTNEITTVNSQASISGISLANSDDDIYFNRIYGIPNTTGTITVSVGSLTKTVVIGTAGNITIN